MSRALLEAIVNAIDAGNVAAARAMAMGVLLHTPAEIRRESAANRTARYRERKRKTANPEASQDPSHATSRGASHRKDPSLLSPSVDDPNEHKPTGSKAENGSSTGETASGASVTSCVTGASQRASHPASQVTVTSEITELGARYDASLLAEVRASVALSRQRGRISDPVWLDVLRRCATHPAPLVDRCMRKYVERHADGSRDERYLLGIIRGEAAGNGKTLRLPMATRSIPGNMEFDDDPVIIGGPSEKAGP